MRVFFLSAVLIATLSFASCTSAPYAEEDPEYSEQYLKDDSLLKHYRVWFMGLWNELKTDTTLKSESCPSGCFSGLRFGGEKKFLILEPYELDTTGYARTSYFNADPKSNWLSEQDPVFNWRYDEDDYEAQMHEEAEKLRAMIAEKYLCVYVSDNKASSDPQLDSIAETFTPGVAVGYAVIYDITAQKRVCVLEVNTTNDDEVNYKTYADSIQRRTNEVAHLEAVFALQLDFYQNIRDNIERQVMEMK